MPLDDSGNTENLTSSHLKRRDLHKVAFKGNKMNKNQVSNTHKVYHSNFTCNMDL